MLDLFTFISNIFTSGFDMLGITSDVITVKGFISIVGFVTLFTLLVTEKVDKTLISILTAGLLIFFQVFTGLGDGGASSQEIATSFIYNNLDIFGFIIGMMLLTGFVQDSGVFSYIGINVAKKVKGNPIKMFFLFSYFAFFMTIFISNIPTIIILAPIVILITTKLNIPRLPFIIGIITFANLGGAVTPISDPTTYYQASTLGFSFFDVISNTGIIMLTVTLSSSLYLYLVFKKDLAIIPQVSVIKKLKPKKELEGRKQIIISLTMLVLTILLVVFKELILENTGVKFDNGSITLFMAFLSILILKYDVSAVLKSKIDYSTLFFFAGIFIVVGALEQNGIIILIADKLVDLTGGAIEPLLLIFTMGSSILSIFVDNIPYNITMVSTLQSFAESGIATGTTWTALAWGLNSCTSIGGAGSPIGAACNVIAIGEAEKSGILIHFIKYLIIGIPLVLINSFIAFLILYIRYII